MLVTSSYYFSHNILYPISDKSNQFIHMLFPVWKLFPIGQVWKCGVLKTVEYLQTSNEIWDLSVEERNTKSWLKEKEKMIMFSIASALELLKTLDPWVNSYLPMKWVCQCTYPFSRGVLFTVTPHSILSKPWLLSHIMELRMFLYVFLPYQSYINIRWCRES